MERLMKRVEVLARARLARAIASVADRVRAAAPSAAVSAGMDGVTVSGRGLLRRWLQSPELRFLGGAQR